MLERGEIQFMAYQPMTYPATITQAYWDKKKGIAAKMAGKTGIGEAAAKAERAFEKIDWTQFDIDKLAPMGVSDENLRVVITLKDNVVTEFRKSVKPAIDDLKELKDTANAAAADMRKNKALKDASKLAEEMAKEADHFSVALQLNGVFFEKVNKQWETNKEAIEHGLTVRAQVMADTAVYLKQLLTGLAQIQKADAPTRDLWDHVVKQQGRSVSNNLKGNPELAKKYLKTWVTKFQGFDWTTLGFDDHEPVDLKEVLHNFIVDVAHEAQILKADL
jgi:hypothetical protein